MIFKNLFKLFILIFLVNSIYGLTNQDCSCLEKASSRIVGGQIAGKNDYPWQVSISTDGYTNEIPESYRINAPYHIKISNSCGGLILNNKWVLTAAHCIGNRPMAVGLSANNDNDQVKIFNSGRIKVKRAIKYPYFDINSPGSSYDIGLLELESPIQFNRNTKPACLASFYDSVKSSINSITITGFGHDKKVLLDSKTGEPISSANQVRYLRYTQMRDNSQRDRDCINDINKICLSQITGNGESSCFGDSGGPAHFKYGSKMYVIGVLSYGKSSFDQPNYYSCSGHSTYTKYYHI